MSDFASDLKQRFIWAMDVCLESYEVLDDGKSFVRSDRDERAIGIFKNLRDTVDDISPKVIEVAETIRSRAPDRFEETLSDAPRTIGTEHGEVCAAQFVERLNQTVERDEPVSKLV